VEVNPDFEEAERLQEYGQEASMEIRLGVRREPMDGVERDLFGSGLRGYLRRAAFRKRIEERVADNLRRQRCMHCGEAVHDELYRMH